ncbi:MAG: hypothetical protein IJX39_04210, partial [Clostridia bacterium]|nr:hypothetical protein [Clostridia bacterium]
WRVRGVADNESPRNRKAAHKERSQRLPNPAAALLLLQSVSPRRAGICLIGACRSVVQGTLITL